MHTRLAIFTFAMFPVVVAAQKLPDAPQAQLQAATINGTASLREQVLKTRINHDLLVSDYLKSTSSLNELDRVLASARPIGGPRWIDDHTCQVRMELSGSQVESLLIGIAQDDSKHSPLRPDALKAKLSAWNRLKFSVVGSSAGGDAIESARPHDVIGNWSQVSDSARRSAISQARADATRHVIESLGTIALNNHTRIADVLSHPSVSDQITTWLQHQPVTQIEFLDDLKVTVTINVTPQSLATTFKSAVESESVVKADTPIDWAHISDEICHLPAVVSGTASALFLNAATTLPSAILPAITPIWVNQRLEADATASRAGSRLKTGRSAEAAAVAKIREQFLTLHLDADKILGEAAKADPQLNHAVDRAMLHAHTHQVDYRPDGSVKVRVSLDMQDAWDELRSVP